jgi:aminoacrylate hydrolase
MPCAEVNNIRLYYEAKGGGPPLLLIAGLACDCRAWANQTGPLSRRFTVIAYDHRGIGKSADVPADFSLADLASDAAGLLKTLGHKRAAVIGLSMGGVVAQKMAIDFPECVERLVLAATSARSSEGERGALAALRELLENRGPRAFAERLVELAFSVAWRQAHVKECAKTAEMLAENARRRTVVLRQMELLMDYDLTRELPGVRQAALAVAGREDVVTPPECTMELGGLLRNCATEVLHGAGHGIAAESAGEFNRLLLRFLQAEK